MITKLFHLLKVGNQQRKSPGVEQGVNANGESSRSGDNISDQVPNYICFVIEIWPKAYYRSIALI